MIDSLDPVRGGAAHQLNEAVRLHASGDLDGAAAAFTGVVEQAPDQPLALQRLGIIHYQKGRFAVAAQWLERALRLAPQDWQALYVLGMVCRKTGQAARAVDCFRLTLLINPMIEQAHRELAATLMGEGRSDEAIAQLRQAAVYLPQSAALLADQAAYLTQTGAHADGQKVARTALALDDWLAAAWTALGGCLMGESRYAEAADALRRALVIEPKSNAALLSLGGVLTNLHLWDEALELCRQGVARCPGVPTAHYHLGRILELLRRYDEAIAQYEQVSTAHSGAEWGLATCLLAKGRFAEGWIAYEARWRRPEAVSTVRDFPQPHWDGGDLAGRTILLHAEQGYGDTIQFVRYAPILAAKGARVVLECQKALVDVMKTLDGVAELLHFGQDLPPFDVHCPLLSVPRFLTPAASAIPSRVPYLWAEPKRVAAWKDRLDSHAGSKLKVGLVWAGSAAHPGDARRSMRLSQFAPLAEISGVRLYSMQKGPPLEQLRDSSTGLDIVNLDPELREFTDTAAALMAMDLLITVDTAVAHLAGALARPVWTLLSFSGEWRWLVDREDSPWYPTMRLFRQGERRDWEGVVKRLAGELPMQAGDRGRG